jgi:pyruvate-ferredoxin/flavodoxin oxidoreductase
MADKHLVTFDGNEAAASVAFRASEVIAIYPITPSSPMGELSDEWASQGRGNLWGNIPQVIEMQSEAGAAGAAHGALQGGAMVTTFTASQGLLLMIPNMYKIAGELTPFVMHVTARTLATHALSIFGDHSDVMACRQTGFAMLCSANVQEAQDFAAISHAATLVSRVPFMHFFDGFRTSHEISKIEALSDEALKSLIDDALVAAHRERALTPDAPVLRGSAQNPDTFFQAREGCNRFYFNCAGIVQQMMDRFAEVTGRKYQLFDYVGHPQADRVVVAMGSGAEVVEETVKWLVGRGEKVGLVKVRLYRPFDLDALIKALPTTVRSIAVMDRTKEPGAPGEPLYLDLITALQQARQDGINTLEHEPVIINGRYGLSSKEFTPAMVKAVYDELSKPRAMVKRQFTVGIMDDVTGLSLDYDEELDIEAPDVFRAMFFGLGADGTVGANKNSIKIIGEETDNYAQGYFVYDSKKSGAVTISHLRFGPRPILSHYLVGQAHFVGCHQFHLLEKLDVGRWVRKGGVLLLNTPFPPGDVWHHLPARIQEQVRQKGLRVYVIDAYKVAGEVGMGKLINTVMQTCFFGISGVLPRDEAIAHIKKAIEKTYARKGPEVVKKNFLAVDHALANVHEVEVPAVYEPALAPPPVVPEEAPEFVKRVTSAILMGEGDRLPVSAFPVDGTWPMGTARFEKRNIAPEIPVWEEDLCIQCNKCVMICPHAAIRAKVYEPELLEGAPETFKSMNYKAPDLRGLKYSLQVAPEDCTGCRLCVAVCPAKDKTEPRRKAINMVDQPPLRDQERENFDFFLDLPEIDRSRLRLDVKGTQFMRPLIEFSGACAGCGETPYIKLMTQLFGDRTLIANATGCSSIYGGNLPTTPYCTNAEGRGPAWANSLFEDNAEFGLGLRLAVDKHRMHAEGLLKRFANQVGEQLVTDLLTADQSSEAGIAQQRERVVELRKRLSAIDSADAKVLGFLADYLVKKSVWIVGGDGWAYDIGFGGVDHVLAVGRDVNLLVLDTEVYSNTGGQQSKATPMGASAKFAASGKSTPKKDLGLMAMSYGSVYVAKIAMGAKDVQAVKAFQEAESYPGPSLIIAFSHCIAHGYDMALGAEQQKLAVDSGYWPLYRFDPRRREAGENPFQLDSAAPKTRLGEYMHNELRFRTIERQDPDRYRELLESAQQEVKHRYAMYERLAHSGVEIGGNGNGNGSHAGAEGTK